MNYENLISIVMPVFNAQAYLEEALESVRRQTWTDWELLVVDDTFYGRERRSCVRNLQKRRANSASFPDGRSKGRGKCKKFRDSTCKWTLSRIYGCGRYLAGGQAGTGNGFFAGKRRSLCILLV